jgi:hypothetical protein
MFVRIAGLLLIIRVDAKFKIRLIQVFYPSSTRQACMLKA